MASGKALAGPRERHITSRLHRPLPLLFQGTKRARQGRFHQNSQRRPRHRAPPESRLYRWSSRQAFFSESLCPAYRDRPRKTFRPLPAQRYHRGGLRRRPGDLRSQSRGSHQRQNAPHARGLFHVRGPPRRLPIPPPPNLRRPLTAKDSDIMVISTGSEPPKQVEEKMENRLCFPSLFDSYTSPHDSGSCSSVGESNSLRPNVFGAVFVKISSLRA